MSGNSTEFHNNPNINHDPPPPSLNTPQGSGEAGATTTQQHVTQHHHPTIGMAQTFVPGFGMALPMPFGPFGAIHSAGPLGVPRDPWNTPGLMGNPSSFYGSCVPGMPGWGFPAGLPPPPPAIIAGNVPPFAPGLPLWTPGVVAPSLPVMAPALLPVGGLAMGMWSGLNRPAPPILTEATGNAQPGQEDITQIPGGIPPGATHIEADEHTIVHVLKGPVYPWLNHGMPMEVEILHMSSSTGLNRLISICNNGEGGEGWAVSECHEMANGMWEKGQTFIHGDAMSCVLTIKDAGWNNKRNRPGGQSLHLYLHRV